MGDFVIPPISAKVGAPSCSPLQVVVLGKDSASTLFQRPMLVVCPRISAVISHVVQFCWRRPLIVRDASGLPPMIIGRCLCVHSKLVAAKLAGEAVRKSG